MFRQARRVRDMWYLAMNVELWLRQMCGASSHFVLMFAGGREGVHSRSDYGCTQKCCQLPRRGVHLAYGEQFVAVPDNPVKTVSGSS